MSTPLKFLAPSAAALLALVGCQRAAPPEAIPQAHAAATGAKRLSAAPPPSVAPSAAPSAIPSAAPASAAPAPSFAAAPEAVPQPPAPRAALPARPAYSDAALAQRLTGSAWRVNLFAQVIDDRIELKQGGVISGYPEGQGAHWAVTNGALIFVRDGALLTRFDRNLVSAAGEQYFGGAAGDLERVVTLTRLDPGAPAAQDFAASICDARLPPPGHIRVKAHGSKPAFVDYRMPGDAFPRPRYAALPNGAMMQLPLREASGVNAAESAGADVLYDDGSVAQVETGRSMTPGARTARAELCPAS